MSKIKKGLAVFLALAIVFSFTTAFAADKPLRYTSPSGNYTAEKFPIRTQEWERLTVSLSMTAE